MQLGAKSRVGVLRGKNEDLDEGLRKQAMKQGALMLCALSPEPAIEALRLGPLHTVDNGVFVVDRAAAAGNLHWVCSWFATAECDQYKMKPKTLFDLEIFRQILQGQEGHQVDATNHRCFCG